MKKVFHSFAELASGVLPTKPQPAVKEKRQSYGFGEIEPRTRDALIRALNMLNVKAANVNGAAYAWPKGAEDHNVMQLVARKFDTVPRLTEPHVPVPKFFGRRK